MARLPASCGFACYISRGVKSQGGIVQPSWDLVPGIAYDDILIIYVGIITFRSRAYLIIADHLRSVSIPPRSNGRNRSTSYSAIGVRRIVSWNCLPNQPKPKVKVHAKKPKQR